MKLLWIGTAAGLFLGSTALADDPPKKGDPPAAGQTKQDDNKSPQEKFKEAKKAFTDAQSGVNKVVGELRKKGVELNLETSKELREAFEAQQKAQKVVLEAAKEVVKADPKSAEGFDAITYVVNMGGGGPDVVKLLADHVENPKIGGIVGRLPTYTPAMLKETEPFLRAVMEKNPSKEAKGQATMALAQALMRSRQDEAEKLFEKVVAEYGDVKHFRGTLAKAAEANLFELRHLQVGMVAPEIEGEDMEGKKFKLSDYRGKVVMLDFWGHW